jgi:hypothetical protein
MKGIPVTQKFTIGQKVRIIKTQEVGTVVRYDKGWTNLCVILVERANVGSVELLYNENALEALTQPESLCGFKPDDRVEIIERCIAGTVYAVSKRNSDEGEWFEILVTPDDDISTVSGPWAPDELRKIESTVEQPAPLPPTKQQIDGDHYRKLKIDPVEFSLANDLNCLAFSIVKHATRYPHKGEAVTDLKKVIHYAQIALERQYGVLSQVTYQEST